MNTHHIYIYIQLFQIKGIGELLEGLIPYSQRHFSRIDRLVRSSFLLDYTLTGMSVIQPENDANDKSPFDIDMKTKTTDIKLLNEHSEPEDKALSKKRKSRSKTSSKKKAKGVAYTEVAAVPLVS